MTDDLPPDPFRPLDKVHPALARFLSSDDVKNRPPWQDMGVKAARAGFRLLGLANGRGPSIELVEDRTFGGVPCRLYRPASAKRGLVVYFHGGGFVLGDLETHDATCRRVADAGQRTVVAVDYRRCPENPFPAPNDDCEAAVRDAAATLSVPVNEVVLMGDSAGGHLAAAVTRRLVDADDQPAGQCLLYPGLDASMDSQSYREFATGYGLTAATMKWFWSQYLGDVTISDAPADANSATMPHVGDLPATYVLTCEFDVLRDEGEAFAQRTREAGVPTRMVRWPGMIHGFVQLGGVVPAAIEATEEAAQVAAAMIDGRFEELAMPPVADPQRN